jgi:hypothetical protein
MARSPLQPLAASRPEALLLVQLAFPPQAPRQAVALRVPRVPRLLVLPVPLVLLRQALWRQELPALPVLRVLAPFLPLQVPRQQALRVQWVPLFRLLPVLGCLAP